MTASLRESSDEDVRHSLEQALAEVEQEPRPVALLSRKPFAYETSFAIDELRVQLDEGEEIDLLVKDIGAGLSATAAAIKSSRVLDPRREIAVYRSLLEPAEVPAPRFYGAAEDEGTGRAWLFLERVPGEVLADESDPGAWRAAAGWAGQLNGAIEKHRQPAVDRLLLNRDRDWHQHWLAAATARCEDAERTELATRLRHCAGAFLDRLDGLPRAFVHGELYASNVIVDRVDTETPQVKPVDWEMAGTGPFALDLAALVTGWEGEEREAMCEAFHAELPHAAASAISQADFREALGLCELALALQWLG